MTAAKARGCRDVWRPQERVGARWVWLAVVLGMPGRGLDSGWRRDDGEGIEAVGWC